MTAQLLIRLNNNSLPGGAKRKIKTQLMLTNLHVNKTHNFRNKNETNCQVQYWWGWGCEIYRYLAATGPVHLAVIESTMNSYVYHSI